MALTKTPIAMLDATGTAGSGNFLRGDGSWSSSIPTSMVRLNTAAGYGSTNTRIRRFTNSVTNTGSDITAADSATLRASFTNNTSGIYAISYTDQFNAIDSAVITINDSAPASTPVVGDILAALTTGGANYAGFVSWCGYLSSGSVIRARSLNGAAAGTSTQFVQFTISRVA